MKLLAFLIVFIGAFISLDNPVEKRIHGVVLICTGILGSEACSEGSYELDACHDVPVEFVDHAITFAPEDGLVCLLFFTNCGKPCHSPTGCPGATVTSDTPEKFNKTALDPGWNALLRSFTCHEGVTAVL